MIAIKTRKKAHHMPALKMVSTAPQLLRTTRLKNSRNKAVLSFIKQILTEYINSRTIPVFNK
jgi:hypothetical protein